jgi:cell division transport system permease protein
LAIYKEQNKNDPLLLEMVTEDSLPASLEISATNPEYLKEFEPVIKQAQGVEEVVFQKDVVDTLLKWTTAIRLVGMVMVGLFVLNSILIIMTVIGMKIALKKDEIEILTLIGASPWYVRLPFVAEGGLYGMFGSFISWIIISGLLIWVRPVLLSFIGMIPLVQLILGNPTSTPFMLAIAALLGILSSVGFLLGSIGSLVALGRYLKI